MFAFGKTTAFNFIIQSIGAEQIPFRYANVSKISWLMEPAMSAVVHLCRLQSQQIQKTPTGSLYRLWISRLD
jgi:hypothetical protein